MFGKKSKLADIVNKNVQLLPFLHRMNLKLGFGDKTIDEICKENNINEEFFIELMQLIIKKYEFNKKYADNFEINLTVDYLKKSHQSYLNQNLRKIEDLINQIIELETSRKDDTAILLNFFLGYKKEFYLHLQHEDSDIFPYILKIEEYFRNKSSDYEVKTLIKQNTIKKYITKHESLNEQLNDLKNLLIKYFRPFDNELLIQSLILKLFELERDLLDHELIENKILFPTVYQIEQHLLNLNTK